MALVLCRECRHEVSSMARSCPQCGVPFPGRPGWQGTGYEWKSRTTVWGYPLVHVAFGRNARGKLRIAKGAIAIGQFFLALTAVAQVALTPVCGIGQLAIGYMAIGQLAVGYYALGQITYAVHGWSINQRDAVALEFFLGLLPFLRGR